MLVAVLLESGTGRVAGEKTSDAESLLIVVELEHFEHVFTVGQFVLKLLQLCKFRLQHRALHIDVMLEVVQLLLFLVKNSLFL